MVLFVIALLSSYISHITHITHLTLFNDQGLTNNKQKYTEINCPVQKNNINIDLPSLSGHINLNEELQDICLNIYTNINKYDTSDISEDQNDEVRFMVWRFEKTIGLDDFNAWKLSYSLWKKYDYDSWKKNYEKFQYYDKYVNHPKRLHDIIKNDDFNYVKYMCYFEKNTVMTYDYLCKPMMDSLNWFVWLIICLCFFYTYLLFV